MHKHQKEVKKFKAKTKAKWTNEDLVTTINSYDVGYKFSDCCKALNILNSH